MERARDEGNKLAPEVVETIQLLSQKFCNLGSLAIESGEEIELVLRRLRKTLQMVDCLIPRLASVKADYVQNSIIMASDSIIITGRGSIASILEAGKKILISNGVVRGGRLTAGERIKINELGSDHDAREHLMVPEVDVKLNGNCSIEAGIVHPFAMISYGADKYIVEEECKNFKAYVNKHGELVLTKI